MHTNHGGCKVSYHLIHDILRRNFSGTGGDRQSADTFSKLFIYSAVEQTLPNSSNCGG